MKITNTKTQKNITFGQTTVGQVFLYHDCYYMTICNAELDGGEEVNAIELSQGELTYFGHYDEIELVDAELIIK